MFNKTCIVIQGPTATGKTNLSLQLASYFNTEIISADSRQCYREMEIGVAKPHPSDIEKIRHYFIGSHSIHEELNAAIFETYALDRIGEIFTRHNVAVMVGGTGLYINAFCNGIDAIPEVKDEIRQWVRQQYNIQGKDWLQTELQKKDGKFFNEGEMQNPQRMLRALEVKLSSGKSILEWHSRPKKQRSFNVVHIGIELPREIIYQHINTRVDEMMKQGLLEEATRLYPFRHLNALQTVGYTELFNFIDGKCTLEEAVEAIKQNTRHYAKRQLTWFKRNKEVHWFAPGDTEEIIAFVEKQSGKSTHQPGGSE